MPLNNPYSPISNTMYNPIFNPGGELNNIQVDTENEPNKSLRRLASQKLIKTKLNDVDFGKCSMQLKFF
mgnify:CR=1 FL=1